MRQSTESIRDEIRAGAFDPTVRERARELGLVEAREARERVESMAEAGDAP